MSEGIQGQKVRKEQLHHSDSIEDKLDTLQRTPEKLANLQGPLALVVRRACGSLVQTKEIDSDRIFVDFIRNLVRGIRKLQLDSSIGHRCHSTLTSNNAH